MHNILVYIQGHVWEGVRRYRAALASGMFMMLVCVCALSAHGQTTTGQIRGTVVDPQALALPGARVTLTEQSTGNTRTATTDSKGNFLFPALNPSTYNLQVEAAGFKGLNQTGIVLSASEERSVGSLTLPVGAVTESVSVSAEAIQVQTASGENSSLISNDQIQNLQSRGRDPITLLRVLPGVNGSADNDAAGGSFGTATPTINGINQTYNNYTIDGQNRMNNDVVGTDNALLSMDAIQEVKVLTNGYQAEYGRNAGGSINVVTKGGTRQFHGTAYEFFRNEDLNANTYARKQAAATKAGPALYRYNTFGGTFGGPVYWPGKLNINRDKLFAFFNMEQFLIKTPGSLLTAQVPTAAERLGNFSQIGQSGSSSNGAATTAATPLGKATLPTDPLTGLPFPGGIIPAAGSPGCGVSFSCINPVGQAILNYFPSPVNPSLLPSNANNTYNYLYQDITTDPKVQEGLRFDFNPTDKNSFTLTLRRSVMDQRSWNQVIAGAVTNFQKYQGHYRFGERGGQFGFRRIISPNIVNEFSSAYGSTSETSNKLSPTAWDSITRSKNGLDGIGALNPANNPYDIIPNLNFALPNGQLGPNIRFDVNNRFPILGHDENITVLDNISLTRSAHLFKAGIYYEHDTSFRGIQGTNGSPGTRGALNWSYNTSDPLETGDPFADALIGHFGSYQEETAAATGKAVYQLTEWFVQDSWKVTRQLTLELGLRMGTAPPMVFIHHDVSAFNPSLYNASAESPLVLPRCLGDTPATAPHPCASSTLRRGYNPVTGQVNLPSVLIGTFASSNIASYTSGAVTAATPGYTNGFVTGTGLQWSPRFGFAYDVFGNGKTAIRGNAGVMKNMVYSYGTFANAAKSSAPTSLNPVINFGNLGGYGGQAASIGSAGNIYTPGSETGFAHQFKPPTIYQYGLSVQHQLARNTILDVAYVGNMGRFEQLATNLNTLAWGARFLPANFDPTTGAQYAPSVDYQNPAIPYKGFSTVTYDSWDGSSNYNALQAQVNRRFSSNLRLGGAYTWSKTMDYGGAKPAPGDYPNPVFSNARQRNYGLSATDQTHVLTINYSYSLPKLSKMFNNGFVRETFDGWQWSGISTFAVGTPGTVAFTVNGSSDWAGGGDGQRVNLSGPIKLNKGSRSYTHYFNTANVLLPAQGNPGNASRVTFRNPGTSNYDMNLSKTFPLGSDKRNLLFRWEAYNVFNHPQFSSVFSSVNFNQNGQINPTNTANLTFGQINPAGARTPRIMQGSLRFSF